MKKILAYILLCFTFVEGTYLIERHDNSVCLYESLMLYDEPRNLFGKGQIDASIWVPPSLWQLSALHAYFHNEHIRNTINQFGYTQNLYHPTEKAQWRQHPKRATWPNNFDEVVIETLKKSLDQTDILPLYDSFIHYEGLSDLFFALNDYILTLYKNNQQNYEKMLLNILDEIPPSSQWKENFFFPFYFSLFKDSSQDMECLGKALKNKELITALMHNEITAQQEQKIVFYRGYHQCDKNFPNPINSDTGESHALSFGTTLLGGVFYSTDACALRYTYHDNLSPNTFFTVNLTSKECLTYFRIGPLHPFLQLIADGEFFHAHTKAALDTPKEKSVSGYYAECNRRIFDVTGYIFSYTHSLTELSQQLKELFHSSGKLYP